MGNKKEGGWISVLTVGSLADAVMLAARLQDQDIPARVHPEAAYGAMAVSAGMMGNIDVLVPGPMWDRALEVLKDLDAITDQADADEE